MKIWSRWVALLDRHETGESLALVRMLLGAVVLWVLWDARTIVTPLWLDIEHGGYRPLSQPPWLIEALGGCTPAVIHRLMMGCAVSSGLLMIGILPRLNALICLQIIMALAGINGHTSGSDDLLLANVLWLLVLSDSAATLSVTCRMRTGAWRSDRLVGAWPRYLFIGQLVVLYGMTGLQKVSAHWVPGGDLGALYYILQQPSWIRADLPSLAHAFALTQLATLATWIFEISAPLLLLAMWFRSTRTRSGRLRAAMNRFDYRSLFAGVGVGIHAGIIVLMDIGPFSLITLAIYPVLWHPDEWRRLRFRRAHRQKSTPPSRSRAPDRPAE